MQLIISHYKRVDSYASIVESAISKYGRCHTIVTPEQVAESIVDALRDSDIDAYTVEVDRTKIKSSLISPSDYIEVRFFDYDVLDEEVAVVRIGADAKNNIHIANAPTIKPLFSQSINIIR